MKLPQFWKKNFLIVEFWLSVVLIALLILIVYYFCLNDCVAHAFNGVRSSFYATIAQIEGALLGFVIAGVSILLTLTTNDSKAMQVLKISPHFKTIYQVFTNSAKYFALTTIVALIVMVFDKEESLNMGFMYFVLWCITISSFRLARCLWILEMIIDLQISKR